VSSLSENAENFLLMIRERRQVLLVGVEHGVTPWDDSSHAVLYVSHQSSKLNVGFCPVATGRGEMSEAVTRGKGNPTILLSFAFSLSP